VKSLKYDDTHRMHSHVKNLFINLKHENDNITKNAIEKIANESKIKQNDEIRCDCNNHCFFIINCD
jgi:hypothetical protein